MNTIIRLIKKLLRRSKKIPGVPTDSKYIVQRNQHHISKTDISSNALTVLNRLNSSGFQAFLVGGSVRDLLMRKAPKDFDVATNATPLQIKKLFRNARIIGRRFKLVHILFHREIIEVATFRGHDSVDDNQQTNDRGMLIRDNVYGSLEEDAWRRDFTINSLYFCGADSTITDYTGGYQDIEHQLIRMIGDPVTRYQEDPVRMLRAIRFSAKLNFEFAPETSAPLKQLSPLITHIAGSRLFDEMTKIYQCGKAEAAQRLLVHYGLFEQLFPLVHAELNASSPISALIAVALQSTDRRLQENKPVNPAFVFAALLWFPMLKHSDTLKKQGVEPLPALDQAMSHVIATQNQIVAIPKRFTLVMREIWLLQFRFSKRARHRPFSVLEHPRFRAAYDFMALRALVGDERMDLADWWTVFQDVPIEKQQQMVNELEPASSVKRKRRRSNKSKPAAE